MDKPFCQADVLVHYGYDPDKAAPTLGLWENNGTAINRLGSLPEAIKLYGKKTPKIRIVFDYDPDFSRALLQIWGLPLAILPLEQNSPEVPEVMTENLR